MGGHTRCTSQGSNLTLAAAKRGQQRLADVWRATNRKRDFVAWKRCIVEVLPELHNPHVRQTPGSQCTPNREAACEPTARPGPEPRGAAAFPDSRSIMKLSVVPRQWC